jgi:CubicO group peptidase (beta-lactamase class C family)
MKTKILISFLLINFIIVFTAEGQQTTPEKSKIRSEIERAYNTFEPTGMAVAIIKDESVILQAFGKRSEKTGKPVTNESLFNIASCTKPFTSTAIGILVQQGKIDWSDKVTEYIPELELKYPYITNNLTIEDILSHRSGLSTFTGDLLWYHTDYSNEEIIQRMEFLPIENQFRADFGYQNNMFMIAGEIIERVSGISWSNFIEENILSPLKMSSTKPSNDELEEEDEIAYPHLNGKQVKMYDFNGTKPAASIMSNVKELSHWIRMLLNNGTFNGDTIINQNILHTCFSQKTSLPVSPTSARTNFRAYGMGWQTFDYYGTQIIQHDGGMPGYISKTSIVPEKNLGIVVLNNGFDFFVHRAIMRQVLDLYIQPEEQKDWISDLSKSQSSYKKRKEEQREKRLQKRVKNTDPSLTLKEYTGIYQDKMYGKASVNLEDNNLKLTLEPAGKVFTSKMKHWHYNTFRVDFKDPFLPFGLITFDLDSTGEVEGFKIDLPINDFHFENLYFKPISKKQTIKN